MDSRWNHAEAGSSPLEQCVYGSRLLGSEPTLVLHGGGNTSIKGPYLDITGVEIDALFVKGSGWDLASIAPAGFTPLRMSRLAELLDLDAISDQEMMRELSAARLDPGAPQPSVESLLHAFLPFPAVQHSHADAIVTLTNLTNGDATVREALGDAVVVVPYVMPGFDLARLVRKLWPAETGAIGMVLMNHGLFTFGTTTRDAYERHLDLITKAEEYLGATSGSSWRELPAANPVDLADLRQKISQVAGVPMVMRRHADADVARFVARPDLGSLAGRGPLTPDHVIRTKRVPMIGRDVDRFARAYTEYFEANQKRTGRDLQMLDPAPRIVLDPEWGMLAVGRSLADAEIAADIYHHTIPVLERAEDQLGGYQALSPEDLFDCEYWDLEQAKLQRSGPLPEFTGMVALVTGSASGIGRATAMELLGRGAAVVGCDISEPTVSASNSTSPRTTSRGRPSPER
jgi:rhamnose utilization protein RhaD (predicted bifunctional aldolase and dehydrogenase)